MRPLLKNCRGEVSTYTLAAFIMFMFFGLAFMLTGLGFKTQSIEISQDFQAYLTAGRVAGMVERLNNNCEYHCSLAIVLPGTLRTALFLAETYNVTLNLDHVRVETVSGQSARYPVTNVGVTLKEGYVGRSKKVVVSK